MILYPGLVLVPSAYPFSAILYNSFYTHTHTHTHKKGQLAAKYIYTHVQQLKNCGSSIQWNMQSNKMAFQKNTRKMLFTVALFLQMLWNISNVQKS